ncbi:MAG TPA: aspartate aminotransferase family protein [Candidatus Angelobacter sp.]
MIANSIDAKIALEEAREEYAANNPKSRERHVEACTVLPGGNTRTVLFYPPFPLTMVRGKDSRLWDADDHEYIDLLGEYTAGLYGHSNPAIRAAIEKALDGGIDRGSQNGLEAKLAAVLCARFPSLDFVRFTNSGTEANLMAISAARAITRRTKVLVFDGAYHGGVFSFAGGGNRINAPFEFVVASYNDLDPTMDLLQRNTKDLAAVIIEPMMGAGGCIPADKSFLQALRDATREHGIFLIFDEVMTSRLSPSGLQGRHGILPDITTLGKYIGGGMTCGAFGGRAEIMQYFDARQANAFPHAGTFNNNVLTMSAGLAGMSIYTPEAAEQLNARGDRLRRRLNDLVKKEGVKMQFTGTGSMLNVHMCTGPIRNPAEAAKADKDLADLFFFDLVAQGFWLARRGMIVLSLPNTDAECDQFAGAVEEFVATRRPLLAA